MTPPPVVLSLDIDGTLEVGDPPGTIPLSWVARAHERGYVVGSSSDRTVSDQRRLWEKHEVPMDFIGHKHHLDQIKDRYAEAGRYVHIGDGDADRYYAKLHGFEFHWVHEVPADGSRGWIF